MYYSVLIATSIVINKDLCSCFGGDDALSFWCWCVCVVPLVLWMMMVIIILGECAMQQCSTAVSGGRRERAPARVRVLY